MSVQQQYAMFAAQYDDAIRYGADAAMNAAIRRMAELLPYIAPFVAIACGLLLATGQLSKGKALSYLGRLCLFLWLIVGAAFAPVVRDTFVDDLPNEWATMVNSPTNDRITFAQQFDRLDTAVSNFHAHVKDNATGWSGIPARMSVDASRAYASVTLRLIFYVWIVVRQATYYLVVATVILLGFIFFDTTRGWVMAQFGKLVGVSMWQFMVALQLSVSLGGMQVYVRSAMAQPGRSLDAQIDAAWSLGGWFLGCFVMILIIPSLIGFGAGYVAAAGQGAIFGMVGGAVRGAAGAGASLGQQTAASLRRIAKNTSRNTKPRAATP